MWEAAAAAAAASIASIRPVSSGLYHDPNQAQRGDCKGCGAPWEIRPYYEIPPSEFNPVAIMHRMERYRCCSYCRRPFRS